MRAALRAVLLRGASTGLDLNFAGGVFSLNNTRTASPAAIPGWSFSRTDTNGIATALDLAGNVIQFATGVPRITNRGILVEEARTNVQLRSDPLGAVAGSPGTAPTGWAIVLGLSNGVTRSIAGVGTDPTTGLPYVDVSHVGTFTIAENITVVAGTNVLATAASPGGAWSASMYWAVVAGTLPAPLTAGINGVRIRYGLPGLLSQVGSSDTPNTVFANRQTNNNRVAPALTTVVGSDWLWSFGAGQAIDCTVRFGHQQLELGAFATSPIITTGAAGTRAIDDTFMSGLAFLSGAVAYTLIVDTEWNTAGDAATRMFAEGNTSGNVAGATVSNVTGYKARAIQRSGSNRTDTSTNGPVQTNGQITRIAVASSGASCINSVLQSSFATPTESNWSGDLRVGGRGQSGSPTALANGYIRRIRVLPYAATDAQLQALTAP